MPRAFALRDSAIAAAALWIWTVERNLDRETFGGQLLAVTAGALAAIVGFLLHEWGHLAGALAAGATFHPPRHLLSPFLFHFDVKRSSRLAFLMMSLGGYLGTAVGVGLTAWLAPSDRLSGQIALVMAALGSLATLTLEVPVTLRVLRGGELPTGRVFAR